MKGHGLKCAPCVHLPAPLIPRRLRADICAHNQRVHPIVPRPPRRAVPDLAAAEPDQAVPLTLPRQPRVMVRFTDSTWKLCRVEAWQQSPGGWLVQLTWGDFGVIRDGWHLHDPDRVVTWPPSPSFPPVE